MVIWVAVLGLSYKVVPVTTRKQANRANSAGPTTKGTDCDDYKDTRTLTLSKRQMVFGSLGLLGCLVIFAR